MGQGSLTGLAQLVAENSNCDWFQGNDRIPDAGQSVARSGLGQLPPPAASRGIRESNEYVRKGRCRRTRDADSQPLRTMEGAGRGMP